MKKNLQEILISTAMLLRIMEKLKNLLFYTKEIVEEQKTSV